MKFGIPQLAVFHAIQGAYSPITDREFEDSQLTATDAETELLVNYFMLKKSPIHIGNVNSNRLAARKPFRLYPSGNEINLNLVYPKPEKSELRLYLSERAGFKPEPGEIWFLFTNVQGELWIGSLPEKQWRALFEVSMESIVPPMQTPVSLDIPVQNPDLILKRMQLSKFRCEFDPNHKLFVARATGSRYVEVHHVIPKQYQIEFYTKRHKDLCRLDNLCSLCPFCHRAIHHGEEPLARTILSALFDLRSIGHHYGITKQELFQLYSVEEIVP